MSDITPYYCSKDGTVVVYCARWEDVHVAGLLPAKDIALVHADPPYGIGNKTVDRSFESRSRVGRARSYAPIEGNDEPFDPALLLSLGRPMVTWGANHYADKLPSSPGWLWWDKRENTPPDNGSDGELAWCSPGGPWGNSARQFHHLWRGLCRASEKEHLAHLHPTQKPAALSAWVFERAKLRPGDLVFVPYLGSGPDLSAAQKMGLRVIGCEVVREYCDVAISRLGAVTPERAAKPVGPLFASKP